MKYASQAVSLFAVLLAIAGLAFLFLPDELMVAFDVSDEGAAVFLQILGGFLIGVAIANWIARHAPLGGIYGRAVVAGTQASLVIAALVLLRNLPGEAGAGYWLLLLLIGTGAILYTVLLVRSPRAKSSGGSL